MIQLNLVRSINSILDVLSAEMSKSSSNPASPPHHSDTSDSPSPTSLLASPFAFQFSHTHALLKLRLAPLRRVAQLEQRAHELEAEVQAREAQVPQRRARRELGLAAVRAARWVQGPVQVAQEGGRACERPGGCVRRSKSGLVHGGRRPGTAHLVLRARR